MLEETTTEKILKLAGDNRSEIHKLLLELRNEVKKETFQEVEKQLATAKHFLRIVD